MNNWPIEWTREQMDGKVHTGTAGAKKNQGLIWGMLHSFVIELINILQ